MYRNFNIFVDLEILKFKVSTICLVTGYVLGRRDRRYIKKHCLISLTPLNPEIKLSFPGRAWSTKEEADKVLGIVPLGPVPDIREK